LEVKANYHTAGPKIIFTISCVVQGDTKKTAIT